MHRALRILLKILAGLVILIVVLVGALLVRIAVKPLSVDFLIPSLESLVADSPTGLKVTLDTASLVWDVEDKQVEVAVNGFHLLRPDGTPLVELPEVQVSVSVAALLHGVVAPTGIEIRQGQVHMVRDAEGKLLLGRPTDPEEADAGEKTTSVADTLASQAEDDAVAYLADQLISTPDPARPLSYLQRIELELDVISVDDRSTGAKWGIQDFDLTIQRADTTLSGTVRFDIPSHGQLSEFQANVAYENQEKRIRLDASITDLWLSSVATVIPYVDHVDMDFPIGGTLGVELDTQGRPRRTDLEISGDPSASGAHGMGLSVKGVVTGDSLLTVSADVRLHAIDMAELGSYWPDSLVPDVRSWIVTNIPRGSVDEVASRVVLHWPLGHVAEVALDSLQATVDFEGLEVDYVDIFPPALSVHGTGWIESGGLSFKVAGATAGELTVRDTDVRIAELLSGNPHLTVDFHADGDVAEALRIVDAAGVVPLEALGFQSNQFGGAVDAHCRIGLPISDPNDLDLTLSATLANLAVEDVLPGCDVADGSLDLALDLGSFTLQGITHFAGAPVKLTWHETYSDTSRYLRAVRGQATAVDDSTLDRLGVDLSPYLGGAADLEFDLTTWRDGRSHLEASATLDHAELAVPFLGWSKAPGVPGSAGAVVRLLDYRPITIDTLHVNAGTLKTEGSGYLKRDGKDDIGFDFHPVSVGDTHLDEVTLAREESVWRIALAGGVIDADPIISAATKDHPVLTLQDSTEVGAPDTLAAAPPVPGATLPPVAPSDSLAADPGELADATTDTSRSHTPFTFKATGITLVSFEDDREARNVEIDIRRTTTEWSRIDIRAETDPAPPWEHGADKDTIPTMTRSAIYYGPGRGGVDTLWVDVSDLGSLLHALHLHEGFRGGQLTLRGRRRGLDRTAPVDMHFGVNELTAINVPALARILNHASVAGLVEPYEGDAIRLSDTKGDVSYGGRVVTLSAFTSESASFGITADDTAIDLEGETIDWHGALIPIKGLNTFLGKIPLIGNIFHKGDGLLAMDYSLIGPFDDIAVKVKPLSIITPAFLKGLFGGDDDDDKSADGSK